MSEYTVLMSIHTCGHAAITCNKEDVRKHCERLKACNKLADEETYIIIEVVNNETGEIREYWNNKENKIKF